MAKNQAQVAMMTLFVVGPMLLLSGITSPYESMPKWVQAIMTLSPLRYYIDITYGVMLKGQAWTCCGNPSGPCSCWAAHCSGAACGALTPIPLSPHRSITVRTATSRHIVTKAFVT